MPFDTDFVFQSRAQARKMREVFISRLGEEEGLKKYYEVLKKSPELDDLPEKKPTPFRHKSQKAKITRKMGKRWRGF